MAAALVWNDAKSFEQHLEDMRLFRRTHPGRLEGGLAPLKSLSTLCYYIRRSINTGLISSVSVRGKSILVPVWQIALPGNSQN